MMKRIDPQGKPGVRYIKIMFDVNRCKMTINPYNLMEVF